MAQWLWVRWGWKSLLGTAHSLTCLQWINAELTDKDSRAAIRPCSFQPFSICSYICGGRLGLGGVAGCCGPSAAAGLVTGEALLSSAGGGGNSFSMGLRGNISSRMAAL